MTKQDVRWAQRFDNFNDAFRNLTKAVELAKSRPLSDLEKQGIIQSFEYTHELAWNVLKDYLESQGLQGIHGSKGATRGAFKEGLIINGEAWMKMIEDRNLTTHTYNQETAEKIYTAVVNSYFAEFSEFRKTFQKLAEESK